MSDFDKYFAERLDEEGQFPHRERNWKAVSKRLDAYDTGLGGRSSRLRYWQAAAAVSVLAVSVLFGKVHQMHHENSRLRKEIAALNDRKMRPDTTQASTPALIAAEETEKGQESLLVPFYASQSAETGVSAPLPGYVERSSLIPGNASGELPGTGGFRDAAVAAATLPASGPGTAHTADMTSKKADMPLDILPLNSFKTLKTDRVEAQDQLVKAAAISTPVIKPVRHNFTKFRVGIQGVAGIMTPKAKGVSPASGAGLTAEYTVLPNLRLGASADWLYHEIAADTFSEQYHFPHKPPKTKFGYRMTQLDGNQRSQYYSLSLAYSLPLRFAVRPVVRLAHTWVHWAPSYYRFKYEKKWGVFPPFASKPEYEPEKSDRAWTSNNWRLGAGLEYESPRWVAGVWADYSKNMEAQHPAPDMWFLRAGVQYKFD